MSLEDIANQNKDFAWDFCIEHEIASDEELNLVTKINGFNWDTIMDVIYVRTGYRDIDQYLEAEGIEA